VTHQNSNDDTTSTVEKIWRDRYNDTEKSHQLWPEWATRTLQRQASLDTFWLLVWPTAFTVCDPHEHSEGKRDFFNDTGDVIIQISMCHRFFLSLFVFSLSPLFLVICEDRWERRKLKKIKRLWRYIETLMMTQLVSLERSWRN
jgi:hypothetical protein